MDRRQLAKRVLLRLTGVLVFFGVSMLGATGLPTLYAHAFRSAFPPALRVVYPDIDIRMKSFAETTDAFSAGQMHDTELVLINQRDTYQGRNLKGEKPLSSGWYGYVSTALFLALALWTPLAWRSRFRALAIGFLLVQAFVFLRLALLVLDALSQPTPLAAFHPGETLFRIQSFAYQTISKELFPAYVVPLLIWGLVTYRESENLTWLAQDTATASDGA